VVRAVALAQLTVFPVVVAQAALRVVGELVERMAAGVVADKVAGQPVLVVRFVSCGRVAAHSHQLVLAHLDCLE
jgi:hypothetical protein